MAGILSNIIMTTKTPLARYSPLGVLPLPFGSQLTLTVKHNQTHRSIPDSTSSPTGTSARRVSHASSSSTGHALNAHPPTSNHPLVTSRLVQKQEENSLGLTLVAISGLFVACQSFKIIPDMYELSCDVEKEFSCFSTPFIETMTR